MSLTNKENSKNEIAKTVRKINSALVEGNPEKLNEYFHEDIMIVSPELKVRGKGKDECIKSYVDFLSKATLNEYNQSEPQICVFGSTATVSYKYDVGWEINGESFKESGQNLFVFTRVDGKWLVVWRMLIPQKENN